MENDNWKMVNSKMYKVTEGHLTDKGLNPKRTHNEDSCLVLPDRGLFLVADGVGGRRGGEVASKTVTDVFERVFNQEHHDDLRQVIEGTIELCNRKIYADAESNQDLVGMASTIALVVLNGTRAIVAHVGDSRVYRYDDEGLILLTEDHSEVSEALRAGIITEDQAATHPRRNVINRALGADAEVEPDVIDIEVDENTSFIICSDGITRHIADDEIASLMKTARRPQAICETMKDLCYSGGAEDNLTVVIVDIGARNYVEDPTRPAQARRANAIPAGGSRMPPPPRKIQVDLSADNREAARDLEPSGPEIRGKYQEAATTVKPKPQGYRQTGQLSASGENPAKTGETSDVMKWVWIVGALVAGIIIGALFGRTIADKTGNVLGTTGGVESRGVNSGPVDTEVSAAYARFLEGFTGEARDRLNRVLISNQNNAEAHFYLGRIEYSEGRFDEAINHMNRAYGIDPKLPGIQIHMAMAYMSVGQVRNARDLLQQVVGPSTPAPSASVSTSPAGKP